MMFKLCLKLRKTWILCPENPTRDQMPTPDTIVARNIIIAVIVVAILFVLLVSAR
ncbi:MAG: hypothetical protein ABSA46_21045 [Thermodesulfovibrionales bacterium]|jgi:hypothetical protein